jgi:transcriptional regulator with XRE-family HTH domain
MTKKDTRKPIVPKQATSAMAPTAAPQESERRIPNLGNCLRAIRSRRRLSLADVSAATGVAQSTLSRIENNQLSPTYDKLVQLSQGLQIDIAELFSLGFEIQPQHKLTRRTFSAPGTGQVLTVGTSIYSYVCAELSAKGMTPMIAEIRARNIEESNGLLAHPGEEFTYVLAGSAQLHTEFYELI